MYSMLYLHVCNLAIKQPKTFCY